MFCEASAVADSTWETAESALSDAETEIICVVFGNPTRTSGRFHDCFGRFRHGWLTRQVDATHVSLTDKEQIARWVAGYGETAEGNIDSNLGIAYSLPGGASGIPRITRQRCHRQKSGLGLSIASLPGNLGTKQEFAAAHCDRLATPAATMSRA